MAENFIAQYDTLGGLSVMAIAGAAHVDEEISQNTDNRADMDIMAKLLQDHYGDSVTVTCAVLDSDVPARTAVRVGSSGMCWTPMRICSRGM